MLSRAPGLRLSPPRPATPDLRESAQRRQAPLRRGRPEQRDLDKQVAALVAADSRTSGQQQ